MRYKYNNRKQKTNSICTASAISARGHDLALIILDPGQDSLINESNRFDKKGELVLEIVCANEVYDKKAKESCQDFENSIPIPKEGDHIRVTGSHVLDTHNGWMEIHPVMSLEIIK